MEDFLSTGKRDANRGQPDKTKTVDSGPYLVAQGNEATVTVEPCQLFSKGPVTLADTTFWNQFWGVVHRHFCSFTFVT